MPNSDGQPLALQRYLKEFDIILQSTQQMKGYTGDPGDLHVTGLEGNADTEIIPVDAGAARTEVLNIAALQAELLTKYYSWESTISVALPNVLTGVNVVWNENYGEGQYGIITEGTGSTGTALLTVGFHPRASAQSSASIAPDIQPSITYYSESGRNLRVTNYVFYFLGNLTYLDVRTRLAAIIGVDVSLLSYLPIFTPVSHVITGRGQQVAVKADANTDSSLTGNTDNIAYSYQAGNGYSKDTGVSMHTTVIPPTIHGAITLTNATFSARTVTATVEASTGGLYHDASLIVAPITNEPTPTSATASPTVTPTTLGATSPTGLPEGLVIVDTNIQLIDYGMLIVHAAVADFAQL